MKALHCIMVLFCWNLNRKIFHLISLNRHVAFTSKLWFTFDDLHLMSLFQWNRISIICGMAHTRAHCTTSGPAPNTQHSIRQQHDYSHYVNDSNSESCERMKTFLLKTQNIEIRTQSSNQISFEASRQSLELIETSP